MKLLEIDKEQLVKQFGEKISRLSHRMIWNSELAKEPSQEVWYEVLRSVDN